MATAHAGPEPGRFSWWDYRAGNFHKNIGMRIDHLLLSKPLAERIVWAEIDREARKGVPIPSDHAPLFVDIDEAGVPVDAGWEGAMERIAARTRPAAADRGSSPLRDQHRRPADVVFALYTNLDRMHEWTVGVTGVADVSGPIDQAGTSYTVLFGRMRSPTTVLAVERTTLIQDALR
jgi:hypothetical protein